jgi:hypothetical protein
METCKRLIFIVEFNPEPQHVLAPGRSLVVMGEVQNVSKAREAL